MNTNTVAPVAKNSQTSARERNMIPLLLLVALVALRVIAPAELCAANIWVTNWQRMLPVINATRQLLSKSLAKSLLGFVREPVALACIEQQFSIGDPTPARER
jgi:hypothetical protein